MGRKYRSQRDEDVSDLDIELAREIVHMTREEKMILLTDVIPHLHKNSVNLKSSGNKEHGYDYISDDRTPGNGLEDMFAIDELDDEFDDEIPPFLKN
ncbi:MAG: hypothetical protein IJ689_01620 [Alphaproteobacteria bacterium]|nr:hypothetical protein [Alphaproteobacteria bacterium]